MSSPTKSRGSASPHYGLESGSSKEKGMESCGGGEDGEGGVIQRDATFRSYTNNVRRLSRSLDGLYLVSSQQVHGSLTPVPFHFFVPIVHRKNNIVNAGIGPGDKAISVYVH